MKKNNFKSLMQAAVLICTPLAIASCDDVFGDVDNPVSSHISIKDAAVNLVLHADSAAKATYTRTAIAASGAQIEYSSSDEKIATVDAKTGKITAVNGGECEIIAKATGLDSRGNKTYQEEEVRFPVKVTDYRARIALKEGVEIPVYNSASATLEPIKLKDILDVWPALGTKVGTTQLTVSLNPVSDPAKVINSMNADGEITLNANTPGVAKINVEIKAGDVPTGYEQKTFSKKQKTADFTIEVKNGVAYISGYDEEDQPITKYMFMDYNGEKVTALKNKLDAASTDIYLEAGWYYLEGNCTFAHNLRVKGDVNIILGTGNTLTMTTANTSIMDETMAKSYSLNFYKEAKAGTVGGIDVLTIQDFKEVNFVDGTIGKNNAVSLNKIGTANIKNGIFGTLTNIETLNFKNGTVSGLNKIGTATIDNGTFNSKTWGAGATAVTAAFYDVTTLNIKEGTIKSNLNKVGTATISTSNAITGYLTDIETLNFKKGTVSGMYKIGTANIDDGTFNVIGAAVAPYGTFAMADIATLNFKKGTVNNNMTKIGSATISDGTISGNYDGTTLNLKKGTITSTTIKVSSLVMDGGTLTADATGVGTAITGNITMNDGKLTATANASDKQAIVGNVEVVKGTFSAENDNYAAVSGTLTGSFEGSIDKGSTWTKITTATSSAARVKNVVPAP
jgi:hypothetical protein